MSSSKYLVSVGSFNSGWKGGVCRCSVLKSMPRNQAAVVIRECISLIIEHPLGQAIKGNGAHDVP